MKENFKGFDAEKVRQAAPALPDEVRAVIANLASVVRAQNGNRYADTNALLERASAVLAAQPTERAAAPAEQTVAARDVLAERRRQVEQEGWTPAHDDEYQKQELRLAAVCYLRADAFAEGSLPAPWPWAAKWWKPRDDRANLVRAGALILADIERLDRATHQLSAQKGGA